MPESTHIRGITSITLPVHWDLDRCSQLATRVPSLNFPSCSAQKSKQLMFSCCKMNDRKQRRKERKTSHLHHQHILPAYTTLIPTDIPDAPPGQKRTRNTCPSTVSLRRIPGHKQLLMINQLGSISTCINCVICCVQLSHPIFAIVKVFRNFSCLTCKLHRRVAQQCTLRLCREHFCKRSLKYPDNL